MAMTLAKRATVSVVLAAVACSAIAAGCGGDAPGTGAASAESATAAREAATPGSTMPSTDACPDETGSTTVQVKIVNRLPEGVAFSAGQYDCSDWSGTSTPRVFNGLEVAAGQTGTATLEKRSRAKGNAPFTLGVASSGIPLGQARITIAANSKISAKGQGSWEELFAGGDIGCSFAPLDDTGAPDTDTDLIIESRNAISMVVRRQQIALAACRYGSTPGGG